MVIITEKSGRIRWIVNFVCLLFAGSALLVFALTPPPKFCRLDHPYSAPASNRVVAVAIDESPDLTHWFEFGRTVITNNCSFLIAVQSNSPAKFYRVRRL